MQGINLAIVSVLQVLCKKNLYTIRLDCYEIDLAQNMDELQSYNCLCYAFLLKHIPLLVINNDREKWCVSGKHCKWWHRHPCLCLAMYVIIDWQDACSTDC